MRSRRPTSASLAALTSVLSPLLVACGADAPDAAGPQSAPLTAGSLTLTLARRPATAADTVAVATTVGVTATARNPTGRPVRATLRCPVAGLAVQLLAADGTLLRSAPTVCRAPLAGGTVETIAPGDSAVALAGFGITVPGRYRLRAVYETAEGAARPVERAVTVVSPAP